MKILTTTIKALALLVMLTDVSHSTASLGSCNAANECRAPLVTVYSSGANAYVVLANHLIPSICTSAGWGYYWKLNLVDNADKARYAMLLAAWTAGQIVELRTYDATCLVTAVNLDE
jgi:hypothetical protein